MNNDLKGRAYGLIEVLARHLAEENGEKPGKSLSRYNEVG
jgi:hypothetical protein